MIDHNRKYFKRCMFTILMHIVLGNMGYGQNKLQIYGKLNGIENGMMTIIGTLTNENDSIIVSKGLFKFEKEIEFSQEYLICIGKPSPKGFEAISLFISPSDSIMIEATVKNKKFSNKKIQGGKYQEIYMALDLKRNPNHNKLYSQWKKAYKEKDTAKYEFIMYKVLSTVFNYVKENPDSELSSYLIFDLRRSVNIDTLEYYYNLLKSELDSSLYKQSIKKYIDYYKKKNANIDKNKTPLKVGELFPEFNFTDIYQNDFRLNKYKGMYIVLDFWGTWCGPCIAGLPIMKTYYEKYKNKIEFISIAYNDKIENLKQTINNYQLNWIQVLNSSQSEDIVEKFFIKRFPTKILISKEGIIIEIFEGESKEFYKKLDKLL